ncbi:MAG: hypothetical protein IJC18_03775 [Clostridia bacterium]|nr:hypothetical protein [Clostridia bacterium]
MITRERMREFIEALKTMRADATDEQAAAFPAVYPEWRAYEEYSAGERVTYGGALYSVITSHKSQEGWNPVDAPSLFARVLIPDAGVIPEWAQPDSTNAYSKGDKTTHKGSVWISDTDGNVWEPGVYGWTEVEA